MNRTTLKKWISFLLAAVLVAGLLPAAGFAADFSTEEGVYAWVREQLEQGRQFTEEEQQTVAQYLEMLREQAAAVAEAEKSPEESAASPDPDNREKMILTFNLACLKQEDWLTREYVTFNEETGLPEIMLDKLLFMVSRLMNQAKTKELIELEAIQYENTPHDGSGYLFTEDFAENAVAEVDDVYRALEAFVADRGKIFLYKEFDEGRILYYDDFAALLLILKFDHKAAAEKEAKMAEEAAKAAEEAKKAEEAAKAEEEAAKKAEEEAKAAEDAKAAEAAEKAEEVKTPEEGAKPPEEGKPAEEADGQPAEGEAEKTTIESGKPISSNAGSFLADAPLEQGTALQSEVVTADETAEQLLKDAASAALNAAPEDIYMTAYSLRLIGPDGTANKAPASVTLNTAIELPSSEDYPEDRFVPQLKDVTVIEVNDDVSLTALEAEAEQDGDVITSVRFHASAFNFYAVCYTVEYLEKTPESAEEKSPDAQNETGKDSSALTAEGVKVEAVAGAVPEGAEVVFQALDESVARQLAEQAMEQLEKAG